MSMGDAPSMMVVLAVDAKFPGQRTGIPPSPTRENPGQVFPQSDPKGESAPAESVPGTGGGRSPPAEEALGNPYVLEDAFSKLDGALTEVISKIRREERSVGAATNGDELLRKFEDWQSQLTQLRGGGRSWRSTAERATDTAAGDQQESGLFVD
ncbi:hypothetical protein C8Q79DRAFT_1004517 [Trametes meyenii]|nr:hypothetical protein C8Q79DRAFT_1004517 [Trametes meyenii]